jgi:hypothetical protein
LKKFWNLAQHVEMFFDMLSRCRKSCGSGFFYSGGAGQ